MLEPNEIIALRTTLRHAANHLDEVREDIFEPYHEGGAAPADVLHKLCPLLNTIEGYAAELRHALIVMAAGGLADDGRGGWHIGTDGPYDTLAEAAVHHNPDQDQDRTFIIQSPDEDDITAPGGVFVMGADDDPETEAQIRSIIQP